MSFSAPASGVITQTGRDLNFSGLSVNGGVTITTDVGVTYYDFGTNRLAVQGVVFHNPEKEVLIFRHTATGTGTNVSCIFIDNGAVGWSNITGPWTLDSNGQFVLTITGHTLQVGDALDLRNVVITNDTDGKNARYLNGQVQRVMAVNGNSVTIHTKPYGNPSVSGGEANPNRACYNYGTETTVSGRTRYSAGTGIFFTGGSTTNFNPNESGLHVGIDGFFFGRGGVISSSRPFTFTGNVEMVATEFFASRKIGNDNIDIRTLGVGIYRNAKFTSLNLSSSWSPRELTISLEGGSLSEAVGSYVEGSFKNIDFNTNASLIDIGHDASTPYHHRDYELINSATGSSVKQMWRDIRTSTSQKGVVVTKKEVSLTLKDAGGNAVSGAKVYLKDNPSPYAKNVTFPTTTSAGPYTTQSTLLGGVLNPDGTMSYYYANPFEYNFTTDANGAVGTFKVVTSSQIKEFTGGESAALAINGGPYNIPSFNGTWRESDNAAPTFTDWDTNRFGGFYRVDRRSDSNTSADDFTFKFCSYNYALSQSTQALKGVGELAVNWVLFTDASVSETNKGIVDGYLQLDTPEKFYDRAKAFLTDNYSGETATIVSRSGNAINAGTYNVTIDATAASAFAFDGSEITIKADTYVGNILSSGTITLANGAQVIGSYGSNTVLPWSVTNVEATSTLQLFNVTQNSEVENLVTGGTMGTKVTASGTYSNSQVSEGDTIRLRLTCQADVTALAPYEAFGVATSVGISFRADQAADEVYNANGIDGSAVTTLTADYPNVQIDISDGDGIADARELYAFYVYQSTTQTGIEEWFGAITAIDLANYRVNTAVVDLKLQNIGSSPLVVSGARIFRDDNTSVLDASVGDQPMTMDAGNLIQYIAPQIDGAINANAKIAKVAANTGLIPSLL